MQNEATNYMKRREDTKRVAQATLAVLYKIDALRTGSAGKKMLAEIRNSINRPLSRNIGTWGQIFSWLPENILGQGDLSKEEKAVVAALQLYALHQQSSAQNVAWLPEGKGEESKGDEYRFRNMGTALRGLRIGTQAVPIDRRFNAMIMATTFSELINHLRQMIKLMKAKNDTKVDYSQLAQDLLLFLMGGEYAEQVKISWAREYYRTVNQKGDDNNE